MNRDWARPEWPVWPALLVAVAVAAGVAAASWLAWVVLAFGGASVIFFFVLPFFLPFFFGTLVFAMLAPSRRWNVGLWLSVGLLTAVGVLGLLEASAGSPPRAGVFGIAVAVAAVGCICGLALVPSRRSAALHRTLQTVSGDPSGGPSDHDDEADKF